MSLLSVEKLRKTFVNAGRTETAVESVDLEIDQGEFVSLLGPSGCGKTTTLRCVAGLEVPTSGSIRIAGSDCTKATPQQRNIGMCFQEATVYPHMSIRRNLDYPLKLARLPKAERAKRVEDMARILKLTPLMEKLPSQLSGGQRQRAALGRALIRKPTLFLLDEPMSSLDAKLKIEMRKELKVITGLFGTTTLYVTHDQEEAMALSDRICVMNNGCIEQFDTPEAIYRRPVSIFVATFIGMPAMNIVDCAVQNKGLVSTGPSGDAVPVALWNAAIVESTNRVFVGIRPEDMLISTARGSDGIAMQVTVVEILGERTILHLTGPLGEMRATQYGISPVSVGQRVHLTFDPRSAHWFDASGKRFSN